MKAIAIVWLSLVTSLPAHAGFPCCVWRNGAWESLCANTTCDDLGPLHGGRAGGETCSSESWQQCREKSFFTSCRAPALNGQTMPGECRPPTEESPAGYCECVALP